MDIQLLLVAMIVLGCSVYAGWTLMPAALRRAVAARVLQRSPPAWLRRPFVKALRPGSGCGGCDSCGDAATRSGVQVVKLHRGEGSRSG
jgi:hypothetical protein